MSFRHSVFVGTSGVFLWPWTKGMIMKKVSLSVMLACAFPTIVMAYDYTVDDANIRNHSYSVLEISGAAYENARSQSLYGAPVFKLSENGESVYYKWLAPDLTLYQTHTGESVFLKDGSENSVSFATLDAGGNLGTQYFYYNPDLTATNNRMYNPPSLIDEDFIGNHYQNASGGAISNYAANTITSLNGNFIYNKARYGGALHNQGTINEISGNFIANDAQTSGGAIYNLGTIGSITGDFIDNYSSYTAPAIYNESSKSIGTITGNFIKNVGNNDGAINNRGAIGSIVGDFIENRATNGTGAAIYNTGTINSIVGDFVGNTAYHSGGAIYNSGTISALSGNFIKNGTPSQYNDWAVYNMENGIINFANTVNFVTVTDNLYNDGTISTIGGTADAPMQLRLQTVYGNGTLNLNGYTEAYIADGTNFTQTALNIGENSILHFNAANYFNGINAPSIVNNGTLSFGGENTSLNQTIQGNGDIIIDGNVYAHTSLGTGQVTINPGKSLTVSVDNIKNNPLINDGTLWFSGDYSYYWDAGTLDKPLTGYIHNGNVGGKGTLYADINYIDADFINDANLYLTSDGTLSHYITGEGTIYINGNITANADYLQNPVNGGGVGTLTLTGGTISRYISENTIIGPGATVSANADNVRPSYMTNNGTLNLTGGALSGWINGSGYILINSGDTVTMYYPGAMPIVNNGTLVFKEPASSYSTTIYSANISGETGQIVIDGDVYSDVGWTQPTTINPNKTLRITVDNIKDTPLTNNGTLVFTGGTLDRALSEYDGIVQTSGLTADPSLIDQGITLINYGHLALNGGTLNNSVTGSGQIDVKYGETLTANADNLGVDVYLQDYGKLVLTGGTISHMLSTSCYSCSGGLHIGAGATVSGNASNIGGNLTNNGTIVLTGGTMPSTISGDGNIVISGDVLHNSYYSLTQNTTINDGGTLSISAYRLGMNNLTNNGTLSLTGGTLSKAIVGDAGVITIAGNVISNVAMTQDTTINEDALLAVSADNISGINVYNNGILRFNGGTLAGVLSNYGNVEVISLTANADLIDQPLLNDNTLYLTGGTLTNNVTGYGNIQIGATNTVTANADNLGNTVSVVSGGTLNLLGGTVSKRISGAGSVVIGEGVSVSGNAYNIYGSITNNGTLTLTGTASDGLLYGLITGDGTTIIDGDITAQHALTQYTIINPGKSLKVSVANISNVTDLTNGGTIWLNNGTLSQDISNYAHGGTIGVSYLSANAGYIDQDIENIGTLNLSGGTLAHTVSGSGTIGIVNSSYNVSANADYIDNSVNNTGTLTLTGGELTKAVTGTGQIYIDGDVTLSGGVTQNRIFINSERTLTMPSTNTGTTNNGTLVLTGGALAATVSGDNGSIIIDGDVSATVPVVQPITINANKSLTVSASDISTNPVTNHGMLWFNGGTLAKTLYGNYGNAGNIGTMYAPVEYITTSFVNNGNLHLSSNGNGVLVSPITGTGTLYVDANKTISAVADDLGNPVTTASGGILNLMGGTLDNPITGTGYVYIQDDVVANANIVPVIYDIASNKTLTISADNILGYIYYNRGTINLTGGTLAKSLAGRVVIGQDVAVLSDASYLGATLVNNGTVTLTGGTFNNNKTISGSGNMIIDGSVTLNTSATSQHVTIKNNKSLTTSLNNIQWSNLENNGTLYIDGGQLNRLISSYGNVRVEQLSASPMYLDTDVTNYGTLYLFNGTLAHAINGGTTSISSGYTVSTNADNLKTSVTNGGTLQLTGGTLTHYIQNYTYNNGGSTVIVEDATVTSSADYLRQLVTNNGTLNLTGGTVWRQISGTGDIVIGTGNNIETNASYLGNSVTNDGTLTLNGGTLSNSVTGTGNIVITNNVVSDVNMAEHTIINANGSLRVSFDNIKDTDLTNNGQLWLSGGTLDRNISGFGNANNAGTLYTVAEYIDQDMTNTGVLYITSGELAHYVGGAGRIMLTNDAVSVNADYLGNTVENHETLTLTGGTLAKSVTGNNGRIIIDGDVISNVAMTQDTTINTDSSLTVSVSHIQNTPLTNNGMLWFNDGTLDKALTNYANVGNVGPLYATADYIDQDFVNSGNLYLTAGTLSHAVTGDGVIYITGNVAASTDIGQQIFVNSGKTLSISADNVKNYVFIDGVLQLTGGTLSKNVAGGGQVVIAGDVTSDVNMDPRTVINSGSSLTVALDNIKNTSLTNYGKLWFSSGTLDRMISYFGDAGVSGELSTDAMYLNRDTTTNNGTLTLTGGTLAKSVLGSGHTVIDGDVISDVAISQDTTVNAGKSLTIFATNVNANTFVNNGNVILAGGNLNKFIGGDGTITINANKTVTSNANHIGNAVANAGILKLNGGVLSKAVTGTGSIQIASDNNLTADADYIGVSVTNNGTLTLADGTLTKSVTGNGNIVIDGDVAANINISQHTTINPEKTLSVSADDIRYNTLVNNGILTLNGGALWNSVSGNGNIVIDGDVTSNITITQDTTVNENKSLTTYAHNIGANVSNNGTLVLNTGILAHGVSGVGNVLINNANSIIANANYIGNTVTNNGYLTLTGGTLSYDVSGEGQITIDGHVTSDVNMAQDTTIAAGRSLTVSVAHIKNTNLTNNGTLWFSDGVLNTSVSTYGNVGNTGTLYTNAGFINQAFINNGELHLTSGTLRNLITGSGEIVIDGDIVTDTAMAQDVTIAAGKSLTTRVEYIANTNMNNGGMLWFNGGTINTNVSRYGNVGNIGVVTTSANYLDADFVNNSELNLTGGIVSHAITGTGYIKISDTTITSNADYLGNNIINNGMLFLTGGTLSKYSTGTGKLFIDGNVVADTVISQDTTINANRSLNISADNINTNSLINNGSLILAGGVLSNEIRGSGQTVVTSNLVNSARNNNSIDIATNGRLNTDGDLLISPSNITNNGVLNITAGNLSQNVLGGKTIIATSASTSAKTFANLEMNGVWNIGSSTVHAADATINGIVNMNVDKIFKDSDSYNGGKLVADNLTLGGGAELRLVVATNDLSKGESSGNIKLVESDSWMGNWHGILQDNAQYAMYFDSENHTIKFTYRKTGEDIVMEQNAPQNIYVVVVAWNQENFSDNPVVQQILDQLNYAAQYDNVEYINILSNIAPTDSNVISGTSSALNTAINNQISDRLVTIGRNGGDAFQGLGVWTQGMYNYSSQSGHSGFNGNIFGLSLGADKILNNNLVLGLGYSFSKTDATSGDRNIDATGHTVFAYGEYRFAGAKPALSPWHISGTLSYTKTDYTDKAAYGISSEYSATTLGVNGTLGYNVTDDLDLFAGASYLKISQDDYTDSLGQTVSVKDSDMLTARVGAKYAAYGKWFVPIAHLEVLYDITAADRLAVVSTEHASYQITGDGINPFGVQTGIGFVANMDNWNLSLNYDLEWRPDFISHTGRIRAKYIF